MKPFMHYIKPLWFPAAIVSLLSLLTVAGTLYIPTLTATIIKRWQRRQYSRRIW